MKSPRAKPTPSVAFSSARFSTPAQADGDSLRRQTEAAKKWCEANGATLDVSMTLRDLGKSAYLGEHRKNPDRHALAAFLKLVEGGQVPRGSALIVESLDRLSREHVRPALTLLLNLIEAGVRVVQLIPVEAVYDENVEPMALMMAIMELSRGHSESAVKGDRMGAAWANKRARARAGGHVLTKKLPAWVECRDGKLVLNPEKAEAVKRVFALAAAGYGHSLIVQKLTADEVPPISARPWSRAYVGKILRDRHAIGELQPRTRDGKPDGPAIPDYYPRAVTGTEFDLARAGAADRQKRPGRSGKNVNVFAGILKQAGCGASFYYSAVNRPLAGGKPNRVALLSTAESNQGNGVSVRYELFEKDVLDHLREIDPTEILGKSAEEDETVALRAERSRLEGQIARLEKELETGNVDAITRVLRKLEPKLAAVTSELAEARQRAARPADRAFGEMQTLAGASASAKDPNEVRCGSAARSAAPSRTCTSWWCRAARFACAPCRSTSATHRSAGTTCSPTTDSNRSRPSRRRGRRTSTRSTFGARATPRRSNGS
jgi:DNA invertase Pin-like site-specific DNA recombinase